MDDVCCECCVLSGRGLCDELITRPDESYRPRCVVVFDLVTSSMRRPWPALGRRATEKKGRSTLIRTSILYTICNSTANITRNSFYHKVFKSFALFSEHRDTISLQRSKTLDFVLDRRYNNSYTLGYVAGSLDVSRRFERTPCLHLQRLRGPKGRPLKTLAGKRTNNPATKYHFPARSGSLTELPCERRIADGKQYLVCEVRIEFQTSKDCKWLRRNFCLLETAICLYATLFSIGDHPGAFPMCH